MNKKKRALSERKKIFLELADLTEKEMLRRAKTEDVAFYDAYLHSNRPHAGISFEDAYQRFKDIYDGKSTAECAENWKISEKGVYAFLEGTEIGEVLREIRQDRKGDICRANERFMGDVFEAAKSLGLSEDYVREVWKEQGLETKCSSLPFSQIKAIDKGYDIDGKNATKTAGRLGHTPATVLRHWRMLRKEIMKPGPRAKE